MIRKFSRQKGYANIKKVLSISLTLMLVLQFFNTGVFAVNNVSASTDKVNICHWSEDDAKYVAITPSVNALNGHDGHANDYFPGELGEGVTFNDKWCADNAPVVNPPAQDHGSLTVTKIVSGGTKHVSDFPLFVNGMSIVSGVASTSIAVGTYTVTETGDSNYNASFSGDCNAQGHVTVEKDESANCTITNTFNGGTGGTGSTTSSLTVTKVVNGGTMHSSDFPLFVNGMSITSGVATTTLTSGTYTVTETNNASSTGYVGSFGGDCNANGQVTLTDGSTKSCTLTNNFIGTTTGTTTETFKVKILKYLDGVHATASSSNSYEFPFMTTYNWTDGSGTHAGTDPFTIGPVGSNGGASYEAFTTDLTGPADYAVHEVTHDQNVTSNVLPIGAECTPGAYRLVGYRTGTSLSAALAASISTTSPAFNDINSERYVIVSNETCPQSPASSTPFKVKILKYFNGEQATASTTGGVSFPFDASWNWIDGSGTHTGSGNFIIDQNGGIGGAPAYQAWTTDMTGPADYSVHEMTTAEASSSPVLPIGASCTEGQIRLVGYKVGDTLSGAENATLSTSSPAFTDINSGKYVIVYNESCNNNSGTTTPFKITIMKYMDGVQATASSSNSYDFPFSSSWDWTDNGGNHNGSGNFTIGVAGWGGSPAYQAWTADMTGPADYATHEITSNIASSSKVLPVGAACQPGMYRLVGYRTGSNLANAQAASLSTTSPSFTDINSAQTVIAYNETCPLVTPTTGTILVHKIVINDNGGTGTTTNYSFSLDNGSSTAFEADGENMLTVATGTHNIVETAAPGYNASYQGCSNINVEAGQTYTCTITNNDIDTSNQCVATSGFIASDANTTVSGGGNAALLSFVHPAWTADVDGASTSAKWIWSTDPVATTTATTTVTFNRTFTVNGSSTAATLNIASDNTYKIWINGNLVGSSTDSNNFQTATQDSWNVSNYLTDGTNTLAIEVTNEVTPNITDPQSNPAGLMYSLTWQATDCPVNGSGGENNGQGGDNAGTNTVTTNSTHHHHSTTIVRGNNSNNNPSGTVLGISTINPDTPVGRVLGISSTLPGLPNTGSGEVDSTSSNSSAGWAVVIMGLLVLSGVYLLQYRILRKR